MLPLPCRDGSVTRSPWSPWRPRCCSPPEDSAPNPTGQTWDISQFPNIPSCQVSHPNISQFATCHCPFRNVSKQSTLSLHPIDELRISTCNERNTYFHMFSDFSDVPKSACNILTSFWWRSKLAVDTSAWRTGRIFAPSISCSSGFGVQSDLSETSDIIRLLTFWWHCDYICEINHILRSNLDSCFSLENTDSTQIQHVMQTEYINSCDRIKSLPVSSSSKMPIPRKVKTSNTFHFGSRWGRINGSKRRPGSDQLGCVHGNQELVCPTVCHRSAGRIWRKMENHFRLVLYCSPTIQQSWPMQFSIFWCLKCLVTTCSTPHTFQPHPLKWCMRWLAARHGTIASLVDVTSANRNYT